MIAARRDTPLRDAALRDTHSPDAHSRDTHPETPTPEKLPLPTSTPDRAHPSNTHHRETHHDAHPNDAMPRLTLRHWHPTDAEALIDIYQDPAMRRWTRVPIENADDATTWLARQEKGWQSGDHLSFAVTEDRDLVACVVLKNHKEVGYWTAPHARGRGVASSAVDALSQWAFDTHDLTQLELRHQVDNVASCRVAEKAHFRFEKLLPATPPFPLDGHLHIRMR